LVEKMEGGEWVLSTLDASGTTTSGGVAGTSGESSTYSNPEIKKAAWDLLKHVPDARRLQSRRKEYKTAEGVLYATQTSDFIFQMSDGV